MGLNGFVHVQGLVPTQGQECRSAVVDASADCSNVPGPGYVRMQGRKASSGAAVDAKRCVRITYPDAVCRVHGFDKDQSFIAGVQVYRHASLGAPVPAANS